jgi:hypothetical protein
MAGLPAMLAFAEAARRASFAAAARELGPRLRPWPRAWRA